MLLNIYVCLNKVLLAHDAILLSAWIIHCLWWEWQANANYKKAAMAALVSTALRSTWFSFTMEYLYILNILISFYMLYCSTYSNYSLPI